MSGDRLLKLTAATDRPSGDASCARRGTIRLNDVYKAYPRDISGWSALRRLVELFRPPRVLEAVSSAELARPDLVWALRAVNLEIDRGEVVGIIGPNGSGKSSLLRLVAGITLPTAGSVRAVGRVGSLLEVGAGLHPEMTGRENIYLNGHLLGLSRDEIDTHFEQIVAFSGLEDFLDMPVKRYSSGMYVRLGFAVATAVPPDILLVDEVLAVGDWAFQRKCLARMRELRASETTILFVSHNMDAVRSFCTRCVLLVDGALVYDGEPEEAIRRYYAHGFRTWSVRGTGPAVTPRLGDRRRGLLTDEALRVQLVTDATGQPVTELAAGEPCRLHIAIDGARLPAERGHVRVELFDQEGTLLAGFSTREDCGKAVTWGQQPVTITLSFPAGLPVARGSCRIRVLVLDDSGLEPFAIEDRAALVVCRAPRPQAGTVYVAREWHWSEPGAC